MKGKEMHVLIVDDERSCLCVLKSIFARLSSYYNSSVSFIVDEASSVSSAMEHLNCSVYYDIIVTDIMMPHENGFVLMEELRQIGYRALVIASSSNVELSKNCLDMGCSYFIPKEEVATMLPIVIQEAFVCA